MTYLSDLFYGLRCVLSHGTPDKTIETGSLSRDRTPTKSSHFSIEVLDTSDEQDPAKPRENCELYLNEIASEAPRKANEMAVTYSVFLTAH